MKLKQVQIPVLALSKICATLRRLFQVITWYPGSKYCTKYAVIIKIYSFVRSTITSHQVG